MRKKRYGRNGAYAIRAIDDPVALAERGPVIENLFALVRLTDDGFEIVTALNDEISVSEDHGPIFDHASDIAHHFPDAGLRLVRFVRAEVLKTYGGKE